MVSARQRAAQKKFLQLKGLSPVATIVKKGVTNDSAAENGSESKEKLSLKQQLKRKKLAKLKRKEKLRKELMVKKKLGIEETQGGEKAKKRKKELKKVEEIDGKKRRKHPLREAAEKYGSRCFQCGGEDHVRKDCPENVKAVQEKICLLCRMKGHTVKMCPRAADEGEDKGVATKICYNCGKNNHRLADCPEPVAEGGGLKFAVCFICKAAGHLSANCPSNHHGIYPKGGGCKRCGSVTHLAKDCPTQPSKISQAAKAITKDGKAACAQNKITKFSGDDLGDDFGGLDGNVESAAAGGNNTVLGDDDDEDLDLDARLGVEDGILGGTTKARKDKKKKQKMGSIDFDSGDDGKDDGDDSGVGRSSRKRKPEVPMKVVKF